MKNVYIVISQTGTVLSRLIGLFTKCDYNHSSLSLDESLETMFSFGRLDPYDPLVGGFVREGRNIGTFKRFSNTRVMVLQVPVGENSYEAIKEEIREMYIRRNRYRYNYEGLFLAAIGVDLRRKRAFYCSQFVRNVLVENQAIEAGALPKVTTPKDFLTLSKAKVVYEGLLRAYPVLPAV